MNTIVNGGAVENRFAFRVGGDTPRDVESVDLLNGQVVIGDSGTPAQVGDFFRAINGPLAYQEVPITAVDTNSFTIATTTLPDLGDDFYIMRRVTQRTDDQGSQVVVAQSGPIQFVLDSVDTEVSEDTGTPANSIPLPVKVVNAAGVVPDFATEATAVDILAEVTNINANTPAGGALTDTQLRASPVAVSGPLTDTELRATPVPVSGPLTDTQLRATPVPISGSVTTGGLTDTQLRASPVAVSGPLTDTQLRASAVPVTVSAALPAGTNNIGDVDVLTLPSIPAGTNNIGDVDVLTLPISYGAGATDATTQRVVFATGQTVTSTTGGKSLLAKGRISYTSTPVTTSAYTQVVASVGSTAVTEVEIFDSSGETLVLATGAAASEVDQNYIFPGGNGRIPLAIAANARVSVKAVSATASVGEIDINFYG